MKPKIVAHRGASAYAPENTMAAFSLALEIGAEEIELDVNQSADGEVVVIHDETLERTTTQRGRVRERPWSELRKLDAGGWFDDRFRGERIPSLRQVLQWARQRRTRVWIEIKDADPARVRQVIEEERMTDHVVVFSMYIQVMRALKDFPVQRALVFSRFSLRVPTTRFLCLLARRLRLQGVSPSVLLATQERIRMLQDAGFWVGVWTANAYEVIGALLQAGADAIISDFPDRVKEIVTQRSSQ